MRNLNYQFFIPSSKNRTIYKYRKTCG